MKSQMDLKLSGFELDPLIDHFKTLITKKTRMYAIEVINEISSVAPREQEIIDFFSVNGPHDVLYSVDVLDKLIKVKNTGEIWDTPLNLHYSRMKYLKSKGCLDKT